MSTDTSAALDQPTMTALTQMPLCGKVMRIATMTKQLLDEIHTQPLDPASLKHLRTIDNDIIDELLTDLTPDLREELQRLALPLTRHTELSDTELRLTHAQLVGWLHGLLKATQTVLSDPHTVAANDWSTGQAAEHPSTPSDIATPPNHLDQPHVEPSISTSCCLTDDISPNEDLPPRQKRCGLS